MEELTELWNVRKVMLRGTQLTRQERYLPRLHVFELGVAFLVGLCVVLIQLAAYAAQALL